WSSRLRRPSSCGAGYDRSQRRCWLSCAVSSRAEPRSEAKLYLLVQVLRLHQFIDHCRGDAAQFRPWIVAGQPFDIAEVLDGQPLLRRDGIHYGPLQGMQGDELQGCGKL